MYSRATANESEHVSSCLIERALDKPDLGMKQAAMAASTQLQTLQAQLDEALGAAEELERARDAEVRATACEGSAFPVKSDMPLALKNCSHCLTLDH